MIKRKKKKMIRKIRMMKIPIKRRKMIRKRRKRVRTTPKTMKKMVFKFSKNTLAVRMPRKNPKYF